MGYYEEVITAAEYIRNKTAYRPDTAVILGSGLDGLMNQTEAADSISYSEIPGFSPSAIAGHAAKLLLGRISGRETALMCGRYHFYEGLTMKQVVFPVFVLHQLGVKNLIITNACGGINEDFSPGDLMFIRDHINLLGKNPLIGENDDRFGPRFPDMTEVYDHQLLETAKQTADRLSIPYQEGIYALFSGPCYETAAEIRAYKILGADAIGMSAVPEATAANYLGMRVMGICCITNMATGIAKTKHSHEAVLAAAHKSSDRLCALLTGILAEI